uniref:ARF1 n=1 Tax=Human parv4 G3 (NG-OR) TaxID=1511921 RepID=B5AU28_9VIRU|nr:ARF1 [Human parv4 G3 (NG-OR)]
MSESTLLVTAAMKELIPLLNQTLSGLPEAGLLSPGIIMLVLVILWIVVPLRDQWMRQQNIMMNGTQR